MEPVPNEQLMSADHSTPDTNQTHPEIEHLDSQFNLSQLQLKQLLDLFPHPAWIADFEGNITKFNHHWHRLMVSAGNQEETADRSTTQRNALIDMNRIVCPGDRDRLWSQWQQAIAATEEFLLPCLILIDGMEWECVLRVTPVLEHDTAKSWIGVCLPSKQDNFWTNQNDPAVDKPFTAALSPYWSACGAKSVGQAQPTGRTAASIEENFLTIMSHELRTPLNAILGFSQLLLRQSQASLTLSQADMVHRILNNARQLLTLVDDILCLSMLEAGYLSIKVEEFDIVQVISAVIDEVQSQATRKQLVLVSQLEVANPQVVNDLSRLRQVLLKLLYNGIKFTEIGEVQIVLQEQGSDRLRLTIRDTGIGMEQQDLQSIFARFHQLDQTITRRYSGAGIGLAIVYCLVKLMQGNIEILSQPQEGTTVVVDLPRRVVLPA